MERYFITFIVPVYKIEKKQLTRCIESILEQKNYQKEYEILLVDDGSPDACPQICDEYAEKYDNIRVLHQKNQGLSVVRNHGVENAKGEWVAFVDGDDWIEADFVSHAEKSVKTAPEDSDIFIWDGFSETKKQTSPICFMDNQDKALKIYKGKEKEVLIDRIIPLHVSKNDIKRCTDIGITWGRIYRRSFLIENKIENIPGLRVMQDSVFNLWAFEYARTICYQYKPVYHYSMYDESISKKYDGTVTNTMRILYGHFADYIKKCHNTEEYWQRLYIRTVRLLVKCLAKDYANPLNKAKIGVRVKKMSEDLSVEEFQTALKNCNDKGQDIKFIVIHTLLKYRMYVLAIITSKLFGSLRRLKSNVS
mgnify:CR=1 FL=1